MFNYPNIQNIPRLLDETSGFNLLTIYEFEGKAVRDYETIKPYISDSVKSVLDIGAGLGGVDIVICQRHDISMLHIIDGDGTEDKKVSFNESVKAWSDRKTARDLIRGNIPDQCMIYTYAPDPELTIPSDLIISLKSWGHHYPIGVYLDLVKRSLNSGGRVVMDLRKKRDGSKIMVENGFTLLDVVYETPKCLRTVFER